MPSLFTVLPLQYGVPEQMIRQNRGQRSQALENVAAAGTYIAQFASEPGSNTGGGGGRDRGACEVRISGGGYSSSAHSQMAGSHGTISAGVIADVHRLGNLLCTMVAIVLGSEPSFRAISHACDLCGQRSGARNHLWPGVAEYLDRGTGCHSPQE